MSKASYHALLLQSWTCWPKQSSALKWPRNCCSNNHIASDTQWCAISEMWDMMKPSSNRAPKIIVEAFLPVSGFLWFFIFYLFSNICIHEFLIIRWRFLGRQLWVHRRDLEEQKFRQKHSFVCGLGFQIAVWDSETHQRIQRSPWVASYDIRGEGS